MGETFQALKTAQPQYRRENAVCKPVNISFCDRGKMFQILEFFFAGCWFFATLASPFRLSALLPGAPALVCTFEEPFVTAQELIDTLPEALMQDDRILSARERELLASILRQARSYENVPGSKVAETLARAIGETVAQRAFAILGDRILQKLEGPTTASVELLAGVRLGTGPLPVPTPSPSPQQPGPHPPSPSPPTSPSGISARRRVNASGPFVGPQPPGFARESAAPFVGPQPPAISASQVADSRVAVADSGEILPSQCVIFEEFLVPAEVEMLMRYSLEHEADFRVSEVLSPGVKGGTIDHEHRRSRVLSEPGEEINALVERAQACLPRVLPKLGLTSFPLDHVEAQITASNHGDFFRWHSDNAQAEIASREVTFVYFFHREPKRFHGGELRIYDSLACHGAFLPTVNYRGIVPRQNQMVFFRSSLAHEITPVECPSGAFGDSRFTVNGWFHR